MQKIHKQERDQLKKLFEQEGIDRLNERLRILEAFFSDEDHVTVEELNARLGHSHKNVGAEFVADTLKLMCQYGFAHERKFGNGVVRYEHRHLGQHHDHMICTKCKAIVEFKNEQLETLQLQIAQSHGFHMLQHRMEIYGICANCLKNRLALMPLNTARPGERLVIEKFTGGATSRMRLLSMGLRVGDAIEVITNMNRGQLVIAVDYQRLVLGRGLAEKIWVKPGHS